MPVVFSVTPGAPAVFAITFDKASYNPGDTITATVSYTPGTSGGTQQTFTLTGTVTDQTSQQVGIGSATFVVGSPPVVDPTTVSVTDDGNRAWTKVSDNGSVAVFTAVA